MKILALRGDGIGPEIVDATIKVLKTISQKFNFNLDLIYSEIGFSSLKKNKTTFPSEILKLCSEVDGIILGPVDHNNYPPKSEGGLNPSGELRTKLKLNFLEIVFKTLIVTSTISGPIPSPLKANIFINNYLPSK